MFVDLQYLDDQLMLKCCIMELGLSSALEGGEGALPLP